MDTLQQDAAAMEDGALNMQSLSGFCRGFYNSCRSASTEGAFDGAF